MFWLGALVILCLCWVGYLLYLTAVLVNRRRPGAEGSVCVLMGDQAEVAEWFLGNMYRSEGILTGRLAVAVAVAAEGVDDTAGIVRIFSRKKSFSLIEPGECFLPRREDPLNRLLLDVRGLNSRRLLEEPLNSLKRYG